MSSTMLMMVAAVAAEIVLLALVFLSVAYARNRAQIKRDRKSVAALTARVKKGGAEREKTISQFLEDNMGLSDDALTQSKAAILRAEFELVKKFARLYLSRDASAVARVDDGVYAASAPYHELGGGTVVTAAIPDQSELEALRAENERLEGELTISMETMSRMLNEYSTMFSDGEADDAAPIRAADPAAQASFDDSTSAAVDSSDDGVNDGGARTGHILIGTGSPDVRETEDRAQIPDDDAIEIEDEPVAESVDPGTTNAVEDDDELAAIIEAAQTQDQSARLGADGVEAEAFEEGESEMVGFDGSADDIDDLFDAAITIEEADDEGLNTGSAAADDAPQSHASG